MAREKSTREGPIGVRLPPETLTVLRQLAARHGGTVHAEIVEAVEAYIADEDVEEIKTATLAVLRASHLGLGDVLSISWTLSQFKLALEILFAELKVEEVTGEDQRRLTEASVRKVIAEMRSDQDTPLGNVGRALGMADGEIKS